MKKIFLILNFIFLLSMPAFSLSLSEKDKIVQTFMDNGNYIKIIDSEDIQYILKSNIFRIIVNESKISVLWINEESIYWSSYDISLDKNNNLTCILKE